MIEKNSEISSLWKKGVGTCGLMEGTKQYSFLLEEDETKLVSLFYKYLVLPNHFELCRAVLYQLMAKYSTKGTQILKTLFMEGLPSER